jgi:acetyltransferase-like isoleucine patch superfamily enzyme
MIKIIKEIGLKRVFKYLVFSLWQWLFDFLPFSPLRIFWMRLGGATIGSNCVVDKIDFINIDRTGLKGLKIGDDCFIGRSALLDLGGEIVIEKQATISARAIIISHFSVGFSDHPLIKKYPKKIDKTIIGQGCFIGVGAIILSGIKVYAKSLVAAGAVVIKDVPPRTTVAGVPAVVKTK